MASEIPCKDWSVSLSPRHEISGNKALLGDLTAKCNDPWIIDGSVQESQSVTFTFTAPKNRENGTPIDYLNNEVVFSLKIDAQFSGSITGDAKTCENNLCSIPTEKVSLEF